MKWIKASEPNNFPKGIKNVKVTSEVQQIEMRGIGLFNSPENFVITYLNGTTHGSGDIKLSEIEWLDDLPNEPSIDEKTIDFGVYIYAVNCDVPVEKIDRESVKSELQTFLKNKTL